MNEVPRPLRCQRSEPPPAFAAALTVFDALPDTAYLSANAGPDFLMDASWVDLVALGVPLERLAPR